MTVAFKQVLRGGRALVFQRHGMGPAGFVLARHYQIALPSYRPGHMDLHLAYAILAIGAPIEPWEKDPEPLALHGPPPANQWRRRRAPLTLEGET